MQKLTKAWNKAPAGTPITTDPAEAKKTKGAILVDDARFAHLVRHGFFRARKAAEETEPQKSSTAAPVAEAPADAELEALPPAPDDRALSLDDLAAEGKNVRDPRLDAVQEREPDSVDASRFAYPDEDAPGPPEEDPASARHDSDPEGSI